MYQKRNTQDGDWGLAQIIKKGLNKGGSGRTGARQI